MRSQHLCCYVLLSVVFVLTIHPNVAIEAVGTGDAYISLLKQLQSLLHDTLLVIDKAKVVSNGEPPLSAEFEELLNVFGKYINKLAYIGNETLAELTSSGQPNAQKLENIEAEADQIQFEFVNEVTQVFFQAWPYISDTDVDRMLALKEPLLALLDKFMSINKDTPLKDLNQHIEKVLQSDLDLNDLSEFINNVVDVIVSINPERHQGFADQLRKLWDGMNDVYEEHPVLVKFFQAPMERVELP